MCIRDRLAEGLSIDALSDAAAGRAERQAAVGLLDPRLLAKGRLVLTTQGRLLADAVIRELVD